MNYITDVASWQEGRVGRRIRDLTGQRFGRLTVLGLYPKRIQYANSIHTAWMCQCDCGMTYIADSSGLCQGLTKSCGCLKAERAKTLVWKRKGRERNE